MYVIELFTFTFTFHNVHSEMLSINDVMFIVIYVSMVNNSEILLITVCGITALIHWCCSVKNTTAKYLDVLIDHFEKVCY